MRPIRRVLCALLLGCCSFAVLADEAAIRKTTEAKFPDAKVQSVRKTPYAGLYEVVIDGQIFYSDQSAAYFLIGGHVFDTKTDRDLTEERLQKVQAVKFDALPFDSAIKVVRGNGKRKLAVFSDPDCPFCKKFEAELAKVTDVTVYIFLFPLEGLHPGAGERAKAVWCAPDRAKAWEDLMLRDIPPKNKADCDNPVAKLAEFGAKLGIKATPTLIFANGRRVPGMIPAAQLEKLLGK